MKIAFAGFFAIRLAELVRSHLSIPCEVIEGDEAAILPRLADADVLVSMGFTRPMAEAGPRLRLVQVPGAGLDRIDRGAMRPGLHLANAYGHEAGIAEYIMGAMLALTRSFGSLDASLRKGRWDSQWAIGTPMPPPSPELAGKTLGILGFGHIGEALARRAAAFDMQVCAVRRQAQADVPARRLVHRRPRAPRRGAAPVRLSRRHALALARHAQPAGRSPPGPDEALRLPDQRRAGGDHRRGRALPRAGRAASWPAPPSMSGIAIPRPPSRPCRRRSPSMSSPT